MEEELHEWKATLCRGKGGTSLIQQIIAFVENYLRRKAT
jgi:hypothetical protein